VSIRPLIPDFGSTDSSPSEVRASSAEPRAAVACPHCTADIAAAETSPESQTCPYCGKQLQIRFWPIIRRNTQAATALLDQAPCFFHPEKAFQTCCQRCGRFVCALCDLQLGAEHVCPTCFDRGRDDSSAGAEKGEWRYRDVLYDSIAVTVGWGWILFWPTLIAAIPATIILHVKYRKAPRSYLISRSGWRFWVAYVGFAWVPLAIATTLFGIWMAGGR